MTHIRHYRKEKNRFAGIAATLNDVSVKISYIIQLLREERQAYRPPASPPENGEYDNNGNGHE